MTTTVVYANPDDVVVWCEAATYAAARDGTGTLDFFASSVPGYLVGQTLAGGPLYFCYEAFLNFDTSWILTEVPMTVSLSLWVTALGDAPVTVNAAIVPTATPPYGTASFIPGASLPLAMTALSYTPVVDKYNEFVDAGMLGNIDVDSPSYFVLYSEDMRANVAPAGFEYLTFHSADFTGTSKDPKLTFFSPDIPSEEPGPYDVNHPPIRDN